MGWIKKIYTVPAGYIRKVISELKKTTWPNWKELRSYVLAVLAFVGLFIAIIGVFDFGLTQLFGLLVGTGA